MNHLVHNIGRNVRSQRSQGSTRSRRGAPAYALMLSMLMVSIFSATGCDLFNPCITLAERICQCEATPSARENCRQVRIEALKNNIEITEDQLNICQAKLETCDCNDIAENRVEECGFTVQ